MFFVDGENFTIRAQKVAEQKGIALTEGPHYKRDVFVWLPNRHGTRSIFGLPLEFNAIRAYYYTSVVGDEPALTAVRENLWALGFSPQVFAKDSQSKRTKGVDITLTKDMLSHAFHDNYEAAVLMAGDGDYVPLIEEVKRFGKIVYLLFFESQGLSQELRLSADVFCDVTGHFVREWQTRP